MSKKGRFDGSGCVLLELLSPKLVFSFSFSSSVIFTASISMVVDWLRLEEFGSSTAGKCVKIDQKEFIHVKISNVLDFKAQLFFTKHTLTTYLQSRSISVPAGLLRPTCSLRPLLRCQTLHPLATASTNHRELAPNSQPVGQSPM